MPFIQKSKNMFPKEVKRLAARILESTLESLVVSALCKSKISKDDLHELFFHHVFAEI